MKIRNAKITDLQEYLKLRKINLRDYNKTTKNKLKFSEERAKTEFSEILSSNKRFLLIAEEDKKVVGYLLASFFKNVWERGSYIDDVFISKEFREKGFATALIRAFIKISKKKKLNKCKLGVHINNKNALKLYQKLGFNVEFYELEKDL